MPSRDLRQRLRALALAFAGAMPFGVAFLALAVTWRTGIVRWDATAAALVHAHTVEPVVAVSYAITFVGATKTVLVLTAVCMAGLLVARLWHGAVALAAAVLLTQVIVELLKGLVSRPRPPANGQLAEAGGFSFPSAHSATAAALFGTLALLAASHAPRRLKLPLAVSGGGLIAAVGASRVLLSAHYPTDVLAGWLTGATVAILCWLALARLRHAVTAA